MQTRMQSLNSLPTCASSLEYNMPIYYDFDCSNHEFVQLSEGNDWESIVCPINDGHQRPGRRITELHINLVSRRIVDFSATILPYVVITDHALQVLASAKLTGFRVQPVVVHAHPKGMHRDCIPKLWEFLVTGDGGFAAPASGVTVKEQCDACGLKRYSAYDNGIEVDETAYDGSDFFVVREYPTHVLVNMKAKNVIESNNLSGCTFTESTMLRWPKGVIKP